MLEAANFLYGASEEGMQRVWSMPHGSGRPSTEPDLRPSAAHLAMHRSRLRRRSVTMPRQDVCTRESARQILGSRHEYCGEPTTTVPFEPSLVSLPEGQVQPVRIFDLLKPATRAALSQENPLADAGVVDWMQEFEPEGQYCDVRLRADASLRRSFMEKLFRLDLIGFTCGKKAVVTTFFVKKKGMTVFVLSAIAGGRNSSFAGRLQCRWVAVSAFKGCAATERISLRRTLAESFFPIAEGDIENCFH